MTERKLSIAGEIIEQGILPLYYHDDASICIRVLHALYRAGIRVVEFAHRGDRAFENFKAMVQACATDMPDMHLGIGTVKNEAAAKQYIDAGALFLVSPGTIEKVISIVNRENILCIPGCMSPSEIIKAESFGAKIVKLFPSTDLGPEYIDTITALFPNLKFIPTGGVSLETKNLTAWINCGVCAVGGSKLLSKTVLESEDHTDLESDMREALKLYKSIRNELRS